MAIMRRLTVCVRATNVCVMHTEGDVINNLPHPLMMMNLIILRKKWSGQNWTGRTSFAATALILVWPQCCYYDSVGRVPEAYGSHPMHVHVFHACFSEADKDKC